MALVSLGPHPDPANFSCISSRHEGEGQRIRARDTDRGDGDAYLVNGQIVGFCLTHPNTAQATANTADAAATTAMETRRANMIAWMNNTSAALAADAKNNTTTVSDRVRRRYEARLWDLLRTDAE